MSNYAHNASPHNLLSINEACARLRCGRTTLYKLIAAGLLRTVKIGSKTLVPLAEIERIERDGASPPRPARR
jgi:excisionase family DNA binding protein